MENTMIEEIVKEVLKSMDVPGSSLDSMAKEVLNSMECKEPACNEKITAADYPLAEKRKDLIKTSTGKSLDDINIKNVMAGVIKPEDIKITGNVLLNQAQIADSVGRYQFAQNLRRAAELTAVPDERVLEIYNALRPYRSTKQELLDIADELGSKYNAKMNAAHVREAAEVYEKRGRLKA
jgi:propanediol dehydratase small subunit